MIKYILLLSLIINSLFAWKMEADTITVNRTRNDTITHINFRQKYDTAPLVFTLPTTKGGNPATLRVVNVTTSGFDIYSIEPQGEDGPHAKMTNVAYIAIEPGEHTFPDGTKIVADTISTKKFQRKWGVFYGSSWESISLNGFDNDPVILTEILTRNNERSDESVPDSVSKPWLTVAVDDISSSGFKVALERSETSDGSIDTEETIAYLAIESGLNGGNHYFADSLQNKVEYETILTNNKIVGWDDGAVKINFSKTYSNPIAVAKKSSRNEDDGGWFRRDNIEDDGISLVVDEDRASDNERSHTAEKASVLIFSKPFDVEFISDPGTRMVINELMYEQTKSGSDNDEFVELYVTKGGNIKGFILSDQDTHYYKFPSCIVNKGDYVIHHTGGDPANNSCSGKVKHFYQGSNPYWNNGSSNSSDNDDVLLILPDDDVTISSHSNTNTRKVFNGRPIDYIAYGKNGTGGNIDSIPTSMKGNSVSFDYDKGAELAGTAAGQSISLTPNGNDSDKAACWELTTSGNAADNGCSNYLPTNSTQSNSDLIYSMGESNNAMPDMSIRKSSIIISDPVNSTNNPKRIPGAIIRYCFKVDNTGIGNADNVKIKDTLSGDGKENLTYKKGGSMIQSINSECDCQSSSMDESKASKSGDDVTIAIGTLTGNKAPNTSRGCAFIEAEIN